MKPACRSTIISPLPRRGGGGSGGGNAFAPPLVTPRTTTREILTASRRRSNSRFSVVTVAGKFKMRTAKDVNVVIPTSARHAADDNKKICKAIDKACAHLSEWDVIGFDTETKPTTNKAKNGPHLLQLASPTGQVYVFDSRALKYDRLRDILKKKTLVGFYLGEDVKLLHQNHKITPKKTIDLAVSLPPHPAGHRHWGIISAAQHYLNCEPYTKGRKKKLALFNWSRPLTEIPEEQLLYAANDAWISLKVYERWKKTKLASPKKNKPELKQQPQDNKKKTPKEVAKEVPAAGDGDWPFQKEVMATFLRCVRERFDQTNAVVELNALKIAEDRTFADCARYIAVTLLMLALPAPSGRRRVEAQDEVLFNSTLSVEELRGDAGQLKILVAKLRAQLKTWGALLQRFLKSVDDQVELLLTLEEFCGEEEDFQGMHGALYAPIFPDVLKEMYGADVLTERAILKWAEEKRGADEEDLVFVKKCKWELLVWFDDWEWDDYDDDDDDE
ncbi:translation initiation factor eIF-2B subunit epsilon [Pseudoscourfieldia marina]